MGYLKVLVHGKFDYFNIGIDKPEISVKELSYIYAKYSKEILILSHKLTLLFQKIKII